MGEDLPGLHPHAKFYRFGLLNVSLRPKKLPKIVIFVINFPKGVYQLKRFLQRFAWGRETQDRTVVQNFNVVALKLWPYGTKSRQKW